MPVDARGCPVTGFCTDRVEFLDKLPEGSDLPVIVLSESITCPPEGADAAWKELDEFARTAFRRVDAALRTSFLPPTVRLAFVRVNLVGDDTFETCVLVTLFPGTGYRIERGVSHNGVYLRVIQDDLTALMVSTPGGSLRSVTTAKELGVHDPHWVDYRMTVPMLDGVPSVGGTHLLNIDRHGYIRTRRMRNIKQAYPAGTLVPVTLQVRWGTSTF